MKSKILLITCVTLISGLRINGQQSRPMEGLDLGHRMNRGAQLLLEGKYQEALPYLMRTYEASALQNNPSVRISTALLIANIYIYGLTGGRDFDQALQYLNEASGLIEKNSDLYFLSSGVKKGQEDLLQTMYVLGATMNNDKQYQQAFELLTKVYNNSDDADNAYFHAHAASVLAGLYNSGLGVDKNTKKAAELYDKAYKLSRNIPDVYSKAAFNLGLYYKADIGVTRDYTKASEYFLEAYNASENDPYQRALAAINIGRTYIELNKPVDATKYLEEAYRLGQQNDYKIIMVSAASNLGKLSSDKKDYMKALDYFLEAYKASTADPYEHASAAVNIGSIYADIVGEPAKAIEYLKEANALSKKHDYKDISATVANTFGVLYTNGKGIAQDDDKAIAYYEEAYKSKEPETHALATHNLGKRYLYSLTKRDFDKARNYLEEAVNLTNAPSYIRKTALQDLYAMKQILLAGFDNLMRTIEDGMYAQTTEDLHPFLKEANKALHEAERTEVSFGREKDLQLSNVIAAKWDMFYKVRDAMREQRRKERHAQSSSSSVVEDKAEGEMLAKAENALRNNDLDIAKTLLTDFKNQGTKNIDLRKKFRELERVYGEKKISSMLTEFEKLFASYVTKPDTDIFQQAITSLDEAADIAARMSDMTTLHTISQNREKLYKLDRVMPVALPGAEEDEKLLAGKEGHRNPIMGHKIQKVKKFLEGQGFKLERTTGSHLQYRHSDGSGTTIASHDESLSSSSIRNLAHDIGWDPQKLNDALLSMK